MKKLIKKVIYLITSFLLLFPFRSKKIKKSSAEIEEHLKSIHYPNNIYSKDTFLDKKTDEKVDLSIIIPFYNATQEFIQTCLDSLIFQNTKYTYKIICVDDGSTNNTLEMLKEYQKNHSDKIIVHHQDNEGISCARNKGISLSNSEYIGFIDQDDWVSLDYIEELLNEAYKNHSDIVKSSYQVINDGRKYRECRVPKDVIEIMDNRLFDYSGMIWSGIYKRDIFDLVRFPEKYWYEDMIARMLLYRIPNRRFSSIDKIIYYKRKHKKNASIILWSNKKSKCLDHLYLVKKLSEECKKLNMCDQIYYKCFLRETGQYLMWRIRGQSMKVKKYAFWDICNYIDIKLINVDSLNGIEKKYYNAIKKKNYLMWKIVSWLDFSITNE